MSIIRNKEKEYHNLLIKAGSKLYVAELVTELHTSYITQIWYNAIFEKKIYLYG